jgi:hypothetical protein
MAEAAKSVPLTQAAHWKNHIMVLSAARGIF